jgi:autotransporter-associated beta strand protein/T5SS/PEP-CTERM-associated repeat protein
VGFNGAGNSLTISNGGKVENTTGTIGSSSTSSNNSVLVTGTNSLWTNSSTLGVGNAGGGTLTVANGGSVAASGITFAANAGSTGTLNIGRFGTKDTAGTITADTIAFGSGIGAINFNQSDNTTISAAISGSGSVNQLGNGTTTLSGSNSYTGKTMISAGTLLFSNANSLYGGSNDSWTAANIIVASNATAAFGVGGASSFTTSNITTLLGNLTAVTDNGLQAGSAIGFDTTAGAFTLTNNVADSAGTGGGALGLSKLGTGTLTLTGSNSYSGNTTINAGTLAISNSYALGSGTVTFASNNTSLMALDNLNVANNIALATNGIIDSGSNTVTVSGGISGSGAVTKLGEGNLNITGDVGVGKILINQGAVTLGKTGTLTVSPVIEFGSNNATLTVASDANASFVNSLVSTSIGNGFIKAIGRSLVKGDSSGFSGTFNVSGNLRFGDGATAGAANSLGSATVSLADTGSLTFDLANSNSLTSFAGTLSGGGLLMQIGTFLALTGDSSAFTGNTLVDTNSSLSLGTTGTLLGSAVTVNDGGTLLLGGITNQVSNLTLVNSTLYLGAGESRASQTITSLTLTGQSAIDFSELRGSSSLKISSFTMSSGSSLNVFNYSGGTTSLVASGSGFTDLQHVNFYAGSTVDSAFLGQATLFGTDIVPVPESSVIVAGFMMLALLFWGWLGIRAQGVVTDRSA